MQSPPSEPPSSAPPPSRRPGLPGGATAKDRTLVAVVWCRQVDNEAESPGYTTVPSDFPGRRETLDVVRIVGNLAVNASDTHDYWDPDPSSRLSYYNNLFLYPARGGEYLCLGRMFLSTEDRPRLGMKTLVLDANLLLSQPNLGPALRRWYSSMGNPARPQATDGKADPVLVDVLSEAFTFFRSDPTRPVLGFVSDNFQDAVESVLTLLDRVPSVLVALSGVLVFPYFLPVPRVNLPEFSETFPLTLALFRIPRNEAGGDRHSKRVAAWASQPITFMDLTQGVPPELAGRPAAPLPAPWWRTGEPDAAVRELKQAIDKVELPRYQEAAKALERAGGTARRRTLQRVAQASTSVAEALARPAPQRRMLDASTLSVAKPYLDALGPTAGLASSAAVASPAVTAGPLPPPVPTGPTPPPPVVVEVPRVPSAPGSPEEAEPPWRRPPRLRSERAEVVTSVPRGAPGEGAPGAESGPALPPGAGAPAPAGVPPSGGQYPAALFDELSRYVDRRVAQARPPGGELEPDAVGKIERDLERKLEARAQLLVSPAALDARISELLARRPPPDAQQLLTEEFKASLAQVVNVLVAKELEKSSASATRRAAPAAPPPEVSLAKVDERLLELIGGQGADKRGALLIDQRVQRMVSTSVESERKALNDRLDAILKETQANLDAQKELESSIRSEVRFLDDKLRTLMGQLIPLLRKTWLKIDELDKRPAGAGSDVKLKRLRDELWQEMRRLEQDLSERTQKILDRVESNVQNQGKLWLTLVGQLSQLSEQRRELERIVHESKEDFEPEPAAEGTVPEVEASPPPGEEPSEPASADPAGGTPPPSPPKAAKGPARS